MIVIFLNVQKTDFYAPFLSLLLVFSHILGKSRIFVANTTFMHRNSIAIDAIKRLRKEKNLSLQELATTLHKSKSAWARKESGEVELTLNEIDEVAKVMGSDFSEITNAGVVIHNNNSGNFVSNGTNPILIIHPSEEQFEEISNLLKNRKK